jgi:hypothetical protein
MGDAGSGLLSRRTIAASIVFVVGPRDARGLPLKKGHSGALEKEVELSTTLKGKEISGWSATRLRGLRTEVKVGARDRNKQASSCLSVSNYSSRDWYIGMVVRLLREAGYDRVYGVVRGSDYDVRLARVITD